MEFWPAFVGAGVIGFIATAEVFLALWRRIVVKPNG
jgi:hypothetical protein